MARSIQPRLPPPLPWPATGPSPSSRGLTQEIHDAVVHVFLELEQTVPAIRASMPPGVGVKPGGTAGPDHNLYRAAAQQLG